MSAIDAAVDGIRSAADGERATQLYRWAIWIAGIEAGGGLAGAGARRHMVDAGIATGLPVREVEMTVASAWSRATPIYQREVVSRAPRIGTPPSPPRPRPTRTYPHREDVDATWASTVPVVCDEEAVTWLAGRGIDADDVDLRGLARVLRRGAAVPRWAWLGRHPWSITHRLVCPAYDAVGELVTLHARSMGEADRKALWPRGHSMTGAAMMDASALAMVRGDSTVSRVVVVEGLPDYLSMATAWGDAVADPPAVVGIASGSWTAELAARVPDGAEVIIATDGDAAGDRYAAKIASSLSARCRVRRARI